MNKHDYLHTLQVKWTADLVGIRTQIQWYHPVHFSHWIHLYAFLWPHVPNIHSVDTCASCAHVTSCCLSFAVPPTFFLASIFCLRSSASFCFISNSCLFFSLCSSSSLLHCALCSVLFFASIRLCSFFSSASFLFLSLCSFLCSLSAFSSSFLLVGY